MLLAVNAALALLEYAIGHRFFPFRFEGVELAWDTRSTGLSGHPLENAQLTSIYIMVLLAGGGSSMPAALRPAAVLLQLAALVPFGGRTATLLTLGMLTLWRIPRAVNLLRGGRMSLLAFASVAILLPVLALGVAAIAAGGFFEVLLVRFADDSGSANTRIEMLEIFNRLSTHDILVGANPEQIDSIRRSLGLELGIENPVVRLVLYQGVIFAGFLFAGLTLFIIEIVHRLRSGYGMALVAFVILINSYESISNKTLGLAQFIVLLIVMFHRSELSPRNTPVGQRAQRFDPLRSAPGSRKPSAAVMAGSNSRTASSVVSPMPSKKFQNAHGMPAASQVSRTSAI